MNARVQVRIHPTGRWRGGMLTDEVQGTSYPCVIVRGTPRWPGEIDCVAVFATCPVELLDAAVDAGFYVVGQPRSVTHD